MSHFKVAIIIPPHVDYIDGYVVEQMSPYDENQSVAPYVAYSVEDAAKDLKETIHRLEMIVSRKEPRYDIEKCRQDIERLRNTTPEQYYQEAISHYDIFNDDGEPLSKYNPSSKWDWYVVGGRWDGWINDRDSSGERLTDNMATTENAIARNKIPHAIVTPDGFWHEHGEMGWWGIMMTENDNWVQEAMRLFARYPGHQVLIIDAHI